jgi:hypothetical protein
MKFRCCWRISNSPATGKNPSNCWAIRGQPQLGLRCFLSAVTESRIAQEALLQSAPCRATRCNSTMAVEVGSSRAH